MPIEEGLEHLGVRGLDMIAFVEGFQGQLPVCIRLDRRAPAERLLFKFVAADLLDCLAKIFLERNAVRIEVDEDEPAPGIAFDGGKGHLVEAHLAFPVLEIGNVGAFALQVETPAVERTDEFPRAPLARREHSSAMRAGVVEGPDLVRRGSHDDDRILTDLIDELIAHLGDLLLPAGDLPDTRPEPLLLQRSELARDIVLRRNKIRAHAVGAFNGRSQLLSPVVSNAGTSPACHSHPISAITLPIS
jgi:hypothetical protein